MLARGLLLCTQPHYSFQGDLISFRDEESEYCCSTVVFSACCHDEMPHMSAATLGLALEMILNLQWEPGVGPYPQ